MTDSPIPEHSPYSALRTLFAVLIGMLGALLIWVVAPYANYVIGAVDITGSYLPTAAMALLMLLVLVVNPLLRSIRGWLAMNRSQLAIVLSILLVACVLPGFGLLGILPYSLARQPTEIVKNKQLADVYEKMDLPPELFPDTLEYGQLTPISDNWVAELPQGMSVPHDAWIPTALAWGVLLVFAWMMMIAMGLILYPQWRRNERLAFPLLTMQQEFIADPEPGKKLPPLMQARGFWVAVISVFCIHMLNGLNTYFPEGVPAIPIDWDLTPFFTERPWSSMPWSITTNQIYFVFIGIAFFLPNRVSISIWFFTFAYAAYHIIENNYFPPRYGQHNYDHRLGAAIGLTITILYIGRQRWWECLRTLTRAPRDSAETRDLISIITLLAAFAGMWCWLYFYAGLGAGWSVAFVAWGFMISLVIARLVAETGIPFVRVPLGKQITLVKLAPFPWVGPMVVFFAWIAVLMWNIGSRMSLAVMTTHAVGLDDRATPRRQVGIGAMLLVVMIIGFIVCGAVNVHVAYNYSHSIDGTKQPLNPFGTNVMNPVQNDLMDWSRGSFAEQPYNQWGHIGFGAGLAMTLHWACLTFPAWPIHPIGLLIVSTTYGKYAWPGLFFGWLLKVMIVRFGGARLYQRARPFFYGLIFGEIFAAVFWAILPAIQVWLGYDYQVVNVVPT